MSEISGAPETTDKQEGFIERTVERAREFIMSPTHNKDGSVTHSADAELGYDPADIPPVTTPKSDAGVALVDPTPVLPVLDEAEPEAAPVPDAEPAPEEPFGTAVGNA